MRILIVNDCPIPTRLDRFLKQQYPNLTQGIIERATRKHHIKVNNFASTTSSRVQNNDKIILMDYFTNYIKPKESNKNYSSAVKALACKITTTYKIAETPEYIVINKPPLLATQGGTKISLSIDDALKYLNSSGHNFKLVHRLDKNTSGLIIIAKNKVAAVKLSKAFANCLIKKEYVAVLEGVPSNLSGQVSTNITKIGNKIQEVENKGKISITKYQVKAISDNTKLSLVFFTPITGRMHQLRVHAVKIGCPIIGDTKYNNNSNYNFTLKLHAFKMSIPEHIFGKQSVYISNLPLSFKQVILQFFQNSHSIIYLINHNI